LERFENEDFLAEDKREEEQARLDALKPPKKKSGRPKKNPLGFDNDTSREASTIPAPATTFKRPQGRPRNFAVVIPSFNGPKPSQEKPATVEESSARASSESSSAQSETNAPSRVPAYSMMQASGLAPIEESQDEATSREGNVSRAESHDKLGPSPKRRRVSNGLSYADTTSPLAQSHPTFNGSYPPQQERVISQSQSQLSNPTSYGKEIDETSGSKDRSIDELEDVDIVVIHDAEAKREALLRQFLPTSTRESSAVSDSSSDSLMGAASSPLRIMHANPSRPAQSSPTKATHSIPPRPFRKTPPTATNFTTSTLMTVIPARPGLTSYQDHHLAASSTSPAEVASPSKSNPRRMSMTPHFPHGVRHSPSKQLDGSINTMPQSSISITKSSSTAQIKRITSSPPARPNKRKASSEPGAESSSNVTTKAIKTSNSRNLVPPRISNSKDITAYFAPKPRSNPAPAASILNTRPTNNSISISPKRLPRKHSPLHAQKDSGIESDDPLSRELTQSPKKQVAKTQDTEGIDPALPVSESSSSDSLSSQVLVVYRAKQSSSIKNGSEDGTNGGQHQPQIKDSEDEDEDDEEVTLIGSAGGGGGQLNPKSTTRAMSIPIAPQLRGGEYVRDDESEEDAGEDKESSDSDSLSSEVLVVRRG